MDDIAAVSAVERKLTEFLSGHFRVQPGADDQLAVIHRWAPVLAAYATAAPGNPATFREIGRKRLMRELASLSKLKRRPDVLDRLHGTTIDVLADAGWTKGRLAAEPERVSQAVASAKALAARKDDFKADGKPRNHLARAFAIIAATIYKDVAGKRPTWTDDTVGFVAFLTALSDTLPSVKLGNIEGLARKTLIELRSRESAQVTSISNR